MRKHTKITVSLLLVVCMLLSILPGHAFVAAAEADVTAPENLTSEAQPAPNEAVATVVEEDTSLRGEYEKHFLMSDGSYQAALYNEPVHKLEAGKWVEIDNTLTLRTVADGTAQYKTANGLADVSFSQSFGDRLVTLRQDDYSVSWGVQAFSDKLSANASAGLVRPVQAEVGTSELSALSAEEQKTLASKASSTLRYRNALRQNVDLEYVVLPSRVKENIILQSPQDISYYVVTLYTENLSARLLENREIEFYNDGEEVIFTMTSPYMYDSAGELSEDIAVEMVSRGEGCYFIQMTPDAQWLNDESRVYPVVIDPQVSADKDNIIDTYVLEGAGVQSDTLDRLYIGKMSGKNTRAYIKYTKMPTLPGGSVVTSATLSLTLLSAISNAEDVSARQVTQDWDPTEIKWDNRPNADTIIGTNISHNNVSGYNISCGPTVKFWYVGTSTGNNANYGILVCYSSASVTSYCSVYSANNTDQSKRPSLTINYNPPTEVDLQEGTTRTLTPPSSSGTVTWSSSNTSIATVNSSGKVTGLKAGRTYVSATVNGIVQKIYAVYVTIADGVYYIKNNVSGYYMSVKNGGIADGTQIVQSSKTSSVANGLHQLWKIHYLGSGKYSFRPMHKLNLGIDCTSAPSVAAKNIGTTEDTISDVNSYARWSIYWVTDGYVFKSGERIGYAMCSDTNTCDANVNIASYTNGLVFRWDFEGAGTVNNQVRLYDTSTESAASNPLKVVQVGETRSLNDMQLTTAFVSKNSIDQSITWSTNSTAISVNSSTGAITGLVGNRTATVIATHIHNGVSYSKSYTVQVINNTGLTFSAFDVGDSAEDEVGIVEAHFEDIGYTDIGTYRNTEGFVSGRLFKELSQYSDIVYMNGHGLRYANLKVQNANKELIEYVCAESSAVPADSLPKIEIGAERKTGSSTVTESYWNKRTKWVIFAQCNQFNTGNEGNGPFFDGMNASGTWARTMMGDGNRLHGFLGYHQKAPEGAAHIERLRSFLGYTRIMTLIDAWKEANGPVLFEIDTNWAVMYHDSNADDRVDSFAESNTPATELKIYLERCEKETSASRVATTVPLAAGSVPVLVDNMDTASKDALYTTLTNKLSVDEYSDLQIDKNNRVIYHNYNNHTGESDLGLELSEKQAVEVAVQKLNELGLEPKGEYRTEVSVVRRYELEANVDQFVNPETIEYTVCFYRTHNGVDIITDQDDGIVVSYNKYGISELQYKWRDVQLVTNVQFMTTNSTTQEEARIIYRSILGQENITTTQSSSTTFIDPVVKAAYLQVGNVVRPVWVCSSDGTYVNHIYIDMNTGEQVVMP